MPNMIVFQGPSGIGKSAIVQALADNVPSFELVSPDRIRYLLTGDEANQEHNDKVFEFAGRQAVAACRRGENIVVDVTCTRRFEFDTWLEIARTYNYHIVLVQFSQNGDVAKEQNRDRGARGGRMVPDEVIDRQIANLAVFDYSGMEDVEIVSIETFVLKRYKALLKNEY